MARVSQAIGGEYAPGLHECNRFAGGKYEANRLENRPKLIQANTQRKGGDLPIFEHFMQEIQSLCKLAKIASEVLSRR
jgi:hypothetical protein